MPSHRFPAPAPRRGKEQDIPTNAQGRDVGGNAPADRSIPPRSAHSHGARAVQAPPPDDVPSPSRDMKAGADEVFIQPGIKPVTELLEQSPAKVDAVFVRKGRKDKKTGRILDLCRAAGVRFSLVEDAHLDRLWAGRHQGVIARLFATGFTDLEAVLALTPEAPLPLIVALDHVQDPGNAGALARTLYALGGAGLIVPQHSGVYLGAAAARIAAGALDKLPVAKVSNLAQALDAALDAGYTVYGADSAAAIKDTVTPVQNVFALSPTLPAVLVLGSEETGLRPIIRKRCSCFLSIPFARKFDSLNVAQAGAVILSAFAAARQQP